jgi:hypothetical protein
MDAVASCFGLEQEKRGTSCVHGVMARHGGHMVLGFCARSATADLKTKACSELDEGDCVGL